MSHFEQGARVPARDALSEIAQVLKIPPSLWEHFSEESSQQRYEFEAALSEMLGRPIALRLLHAESVQAAERGISDLFSEEPTPSQYYDLLNSVLIFYGVPRLDRSLFDRYFDMTSFQGTDQFKRSIRAFQKDAIRLFSTFGEAYRVLNERDGVTRLKDLEPRPLTQFAERTIWERAEPDPGRDQIVTIAEEKLPYLGYISAAKYREQKRKRDQLARYLRELAGQIRESGAQAVEELTLKRKRKLDSLLRELGSTLQHTPMSALFVPDAVQLEAEAARMLRDEADESEMEQTQSQALKNLSRYVSSDHMDVYVATSMRSQSDFVSVNRFVTALFQHESVASLRLRYFNPTQSWIEDRVAKGLVEALMLRRAEVTLYMAQKSDTFGKDSEASVALGQGKPVVVYVPRLYDDATGIDSENLAGMSEDKLRLEIQRHGKGDAAEDLDDLNHSALFSAALTLKLQDLDGGDLYRVVREHSADFALEDESARIRGEHEQERRITYSEWITSLGKEPVGEVPDEIRADLVQILVAVSSNFEFRRARVFRDSHPLALQVILSSGVLNGILVARSVAQCASLLRGIFSNELQFDLDEDAENYRLVERGTRSTVRVISKNKMLVNALDNLYGRLR